MRNFSSLKDFMKNGCGANDEMNANGEVFDTDRIMFLRNYLIQLQRATSQGVPVRGYFLWSLMYARTSALPLRSQALEIKRFAPAIQRCNEL